jgi:hypothetical protein
MSFFDDEEPIWDTEDEHKAVLEAIAEQQEIIGNPSSSAADVDRAVKMMGSLSVERDTYVKAHEAWVAASHGSEKKEALATKNEARAALDAAKPELTKEELHDEVAAALGIKEQWQPKTKSEFDWVVNKILCLEEEGARIQAVAAERIAGLQGHVSYLKKRYWDDLEKFSESDREPGKQYCQFDSGRMQARNSSGGWVINDKALLLGELAKLTPVQQKALTVEKYTAYRYENLDAIKSYCQKEGDTLNGAMEFKSPSTNWTIQGPKEK